MIREGETGLMAASGDEASLADALSAMAALSSAERAAMGKVGRTWMASEFSATNYRDRTLALTARLVPGELFDFQQENVVGPEGTSLVSVKDTALTFGHRLCTLPFNPTGESVQRP